jgi:glutamine amidotransferase
MNLAIVDVGCGNIGSVGIAFERFGLAPRITADPAEIAGADKVILPGVGAAGYAMAEMRARGLVDTLRALTQPVLGICLGMQLLFERSEEGDTDCLGILPDRVKRLQAAQGRPVPHMGWNQLSPVRGDPILEGIAADDYVYFVHSFAVPVSDLTIASADYGICLAAIVRRGNFWGTQFHPERSAATGARVLANFLRLS